MVGGIRKNPFPLQVGLHYFTRKKLVYDNYENFQLRHYNLKGKAKSRTAKKINFYLILKSLRHFRVWDIDSWYLLFLMLFLSFRNIVTGEDFA